MGGSEWMPDPQSKSLGLVLSIAAHTLGYWILERGEGFLSLCLWQLPYIPLITSVIFQSPSPGESCHSSSPQIPTLLLSFYQASPPHSGASLAPPPALLTGPHPICVLSPSTHATSEDPLKTLRAPCILQDTCLLPTHRSVIKSLWVPNWKICSESR